LTALAGANLIYGLGMMEMGVTFDFGQLVMDNEFAQMIKNCVAGIAVTDDTLSVDMIREVGPFKDFLSHPETFKHMRSTSHPKLIDRRNRDKWQAAGATDIYPRAVAEAKRLLATHQPPPLSDDIRAQLREIVTETEAHLGFAHSQAPF
jgi:trimethylamine--corrinoid protein Co-methyltransferase